MSLSKLAYQVEMAPKLSLAVFFFKDVSWAIVPFLFAKQNNLSSRSVTVPLRFFRRPGRGTKKCQEKVKVLQARVQHLETQLDELNSAPWWFSKVEGSFYPQTHTPRAPTWVFVGGLIVIPFH